MRKLLTTVAGLGLLVAVSGCTEGHLCGYCDCDPGHDRCYYYYGPGLVSNYHPLHAGGGPAPEQAPPPKVETPKEK